MKDATFRTGPATAYHDAPTPRDLKILCHGSVVESVLRNMDIVDARQELFLLI